MVIDSSSVESILQKDSKSAPGLKSYYKSKLSQLQIVIRDKTSDVRRLEAQRNDLNAKVRALKDELQHLHEPGIFFYFLFSIFLFFLSLCQT